MGLLLLESGDVDNALACFKNGQLADADSEKELYQSDYGILQLLEAKCHQIRGERENYESLKDKAIHSFAVSHPRRVETQAESLMALNGLTAEELESRKQAIYEKLESVEAEIMESYSSYYSPLLGDFNTLVLLGMGESPKMVRTGEYHQNRVIYKIPNPEYHYEVLIDEKGWHDVVRGFANVSYQATTRGDRAMDEVLAGQARFKKGTADFGNTMFDVANNSSDPYVQLAFLSIGLVAHAASASANAKADLRWWKTLPDEIGIVPLSLPAGKHIIAVDCYDRKLRRSRRITQEIVCNGKPFEFHFVSLGPRIASELEMKDVEKTVAQANGS